MILRYGIDSWHGKVHPTPGDARRGTAVNGLLINGARLPGVSVMIGHDMGAFTRRVYGGSLNARTECSPTTGKLIPQPPFQPPLTSESSIIRGQKAHKFSN